ncbi:hypothetical protein J2W68_003416 [Luteimonas terrae]|uniref:Uncharacterized protein n=1 Tax=Luteimonas terrae TaxID=1530191 RepID=A0ABU1Y1G2_9GAMM|nr:hypothetical protein [Luteimonas terrae]
MRALPDVAAWSQSTHPTRVAQRTLPKGAVGTTFQLGRDTRLVSTEVAGRELRHLMTT